LKEPERQIDVDDDERVAYERNQSVSNLAAIVRRLTQTGQ